MHTSDNYSRLSGDYNVGNICSNNTKTDKDTGAQAHEPKTTEHTVLDSKYPSMIFRAKELLKKKITTTTSSVLDYLTRPKGDDPKNERIYQTLIRTLRANYNNCELAESRAETLRALSFGALSRVFFGLGPFFMRNIFGGGEVAEQATRTVQEKLWDFMQPALLSGGSYMTGSLVVTFAGDQQAKVIESFSQALNRRIAQALIYKGVEFSEKRNIAELNTILQKGKSAQENLLRHSLSTFGPSSFGLGVSMLGLGYIHPVLLAVAPINIAFLKFLNGNRHIKLRETESGQNDSSEAASKAIEAIKRNLEDIQTSSNAEAMEKLLTTLGEQVEARVKEQSVQTNWTNFRASFPMWATKLSTIAISGALMAYGEIDHGELLASFLYSENMSYNFDAMQAIYYNTNPPN